MSDESQDFLPYDPGDLDRTNASQDLLDLLDQVDRDIKGWMPEAGDKVYGRIVDISEARSDFQKSPSNPEGIYPLLVIETPGGTLVGVHCFHTVLKNEIVRRTQRGMKVGDQIAIAYRGEADTAGSGKNAANLYRVAIKPS